MAILYRKVGKYSGPVIFGSETLPPPGIKTAEYHAERAYWLTGQVETGNRTGSVMMADGTGFTIGQDQHIAVYPRELADEDYNASDDQGSAWSLLATIERSHGPVGPLWEAFKTEGWYVATNGSLRWLNDGRSKINGRWLEHKSGDLVHGAVIRDTITPVCGVVEKGSDGWETARKWATLLHELTSDKKTWNIQKHFGLQHLINRVETHKIRTSDHRRKMTIRQALYGNTNTAVVKSYQLGFQLDLALCVFHSYTVNAPSIAYRLLTESINDIGWKLSHGLSARIVFADNLLTRIRMKKYGRWDRRWERTRKEAMKTEWWPKELFQGPTALMPKQ